MIADSDVEQTEIMYVCDLLTYVTGYWVQLMQIVELCTHCNIQAPHWAQIIGVFVVPGSAGVCHMPSLSMPSQGAKRGA